jgi:hypothetical protein
MGYSTGKIFNLLSSHSLSIEWNADNQQRYGKLAEILLELWKSRPAEDGSTLATGVYAFIIRCFRSWLFAKQKTTGWGNRFSC